MGFECSRGEDVLAEAKGQVETKAGIEPAVGLQSVIV
jgi:hypothetical protein